MLRRLVVPLVLGLALAGAGGAVAGASQVSIASSNAASGNTTTPRPATGRNRFTMSVIAATTRLTRESAAKKCRFTPP